MSTARRSRRQTQYFVLHRDGHEPQIARITTRGASSFYDPDSGSWIHDPLLGAEIRMTDEWTTAAPHDLPDGVLTGGGSSQPAHSRGLLGRRRR